MLKVDDKTLNPAQKPIELLSFLLEVFSAAGGFVLDLCSGTASGGEAAMQNKRSYLGVDSSKKMTDMSKERLIAAIAKSSQPANKINDSSQPTGQEAVVSCAVCHLTLEDDAIKCIKCPKFTHQNCATVKQEDESEDALTPFCSKQCLAAYDQPSA